MRGEPSNPPARCRLSYKDARELEQLPARIEMLETELARMAAAMHEPAFYQRDAAAIAQRHGHEGLERGEARAVCRGGVGQRMQGS